MVTLQRNFKEETGYKWHMMMIIDRTNLVLEVRKWVIIWLNALVGEEGRVKGWVFQYTVG